MGARTIRVCSKTKKHLASCNQVVKRGYLKKTIKASKKKPQKVFSPKSKWLMTCYEYLLKSIRGTRSFSGWQGTIKCYWFHFNRCNSYSRFWSLFFCQNPAIWLVRSQEVCIISMLQMMVDFLTSINGFWSKKKLLVPVGLMTNHDHFFQPIFSQYEQPAN